jgi:hypothetical protein
MIGWGRSRICRCAAAHASGNHCRRLLADHSRARATRREAIAATLADNREDAEGDEEADDAA